MFFILIWKLTHQLLKSRYYYAAYVFISFTLMWRQEEETVDIIEAGKIKEGRMRETISLLSISLLPGCDEPLCCPPFFPVNGLCHSDDPLVNDFYDL